MKWPIYLSRGPPPVIYHLCTISDYKKAQNEKVDYIPPTFEIDGKFIHATEDPNFLLFVGTYFYKQSVGDWICLKLNPALVNGSVVYEAAAPVGDIPAFAHDADKTFPHIYGSIPSRSVIRIFPVIRGEDGSFLNIPGL